MLLTAGLALSLNSSGLLAAMMLGFMVVNFVERQEDAFAAIDEIEEPLFGIFFALAGAHVELGLLHTRRLAGAGDCRIKVRGKVAW